MKKDAFTIVEVLAAIVVVGLSLVAVMSMISMGHAQNQLDKERLIAADLLVRKMEEIKSIGFANAANQTNFTYSGYSNFPLDVTITANYSGNANLMKVDTTVRWMNIYNISESHQVSTLLANYP